MLKFILPLVFLSFSLNAQPGILDPSFGTNGRVLQSSVPGDGGLKIKVLPDDKFLVLSGLPMVIKYLPDGAIDSSFGLYGLAISDTSRHMLCFDMNVQPDQKILVCGAQWNYVLGQYDFLIFRFLPNGAIDSSFGTNGYSMADVDATEDLGYSMALQADGKIIITGQSTYTVTTLTPEYAAVRFNTNGKIDSSFGTNGVVQIVPPYGTGISGRVAITKNNKIILVGTIPVPGDADDIGLLCLKNDGSIDSSFGTNGYTYADYNGQADWVSSILPSSDGGLIVMGSTMVFNTSSALLVFKVDANGVLDQAWGGGYQIINNGRPYNGYGGEIMFDKNKDCIALNGFTNNYGHINTYIFKLDSSGYFQSNFGNAGFVNITDSIIASHVAIQSNNKILACGETSVQVNPTKIITLRYSNTPALSVEHFTRTADIKIFPNPASSFIQVKIISGDLNGRIRLTALNGTVLLNAKTYGADSYKVDLTNFSPGFYYVQYTSGDQAETTKMISVIR